MKIDNQIKELIKETEIEVSEELKKIDEICEYNSEKVLNAFQSNELSEVHFNATTGYGYDDIGRETIEKIYAQIY